MFEKANRKVAESRFFLLQLRQASELDATEFSFNALLNAGKNVVNAIHAQLRASERGRLPVAQADAAGKAAYGRHLKAWKRNVGPVSSALFDVLQAARDIEMHADRTAVRHDTRETERQVRQTVSPHSAFAPIFAANLAIGAISAEITEFTTTYELRIDPAASGKRRMNALFKQFSQTKQKPTAEVALSYVGLLESLVTYFDKEYV